MERDQAKEKEDKGGVDNLGGERQDRDTDASARGQSEEMSGMMGFVQDLQTTIKKVVNEDLEPSYRSRIGRLTGSNGLRAQVQSWQANTEQEIQDVFDAKLGNSAVDSGPRKALEASRGRLLQAIRSGQKELYQRLSEIDAKSDTAHATEIKKEIAGAQNAFRLTQRRSNVRLQMFRDTISGDVNESIVLARSNTQKTKGKAHGNYERRSAEAAVAGVLATLPKIRSLNDGNVKWVNQMMRDQRALRSTFIAQTIDTFQGGAEGIERWAPAINALNEVYFGLEDTRSELEDLLATWKSEGKEIIFGADVNIVVSALAGAWKQQQRAFDSVREVLNEHQADQKKKEDVAQVAVNTFKTIEAFSDAAAIALLSPAGGTFVLKSFAKFALTNITYRVGKRVVGESISSAAGWSESKSAKDWFKTIGAEVANASVDSLMAGFGANVMPWLAKASKIPPNAQQVLFREVALDLFSGMTVGTFGDIAKAAAAGENWKVYDLLGKNLKNATIGVLFKNMGRKITAKQPKLAKEKVVVPGVITRAKDAQFRLDKAIAKGDSTAINTALIQYRKAAWLKIEHLKMQKESTAQLEKELSAYGRELLGRLLKTLPKNVTRGITEEAIKKVLEGSSDSLFGYQ